MQSAAGFVGDVVEVDVFEDGIEVLASLFHAGAERAVAAPI
jgi:hypothetical protein